MCKNLTIYVYLILMVSLHLLRQTLIINQTLLILDQTSQNHSPQQFPSRAEIDMMDEYNLERSHLAFTIGKKVLTNGQSSMVLYPQTTVFSAEMAEDGGKQSETDSETESSTDRISASSCNRNIYKYAPRSGFAESNEEVLVFLRNKLEPRKFGSKSN
jgi:hypothetical protein